MNKKYFRKVVGIAALAFFILVIVIIATCNAFVYYNAKGKDFSEIDSIPNNINGVGLLLGTTPYSRIGHDENQFFKYRIEAAIKLYNAKKVSCFLISGDRHSLYGINEPQCMEDSLMLHGIPPERIYLDEEGNSTIESIYRATKKYGLLSFVIISQRYHNERALYLAEHLGLGVENIKAFDAETPRLSLWMLWIYLRESLARVKMLWNIITDHKPQDVGSIDPLGEKIVVDQMMSGDFLMTINTIDANDERDTIVGNFTGKGNDTLFVIEKIDSSNEDSMYGPYGDYYAVSTNKSIPSIHLSRCLRMASPKLVNEGDLDRNGTCEVGFLSTWDNSQWRLYRIFTLVEGQWRYLVYGDYLDTPEWFRHSGMRIAQPGKLKGEILIHYAGDTREYMGVKDTIVKPTYSRITDLDD